MTRWMTVHATHGVSLARNVGYLSIGHGFYLEDATETDIKLYANLGILARAAVINPQNPRQVPAFWRRPIRIPFLRLLRKLASSGSGAVSQRYRSSRPHSGLPMAGTIFSTT
jgi:hypothetical protein